MPIENSDNWFLKKHENGEIFGPVRFRKIQEWAQSAQVNSQDMVSQDKSAWTKAPMVPELKMDYLIVVGQDLLYGPTTEGALLEFARLGEVNAETQLINCSTGEALLLETAPFYQKAQKSLQDAAPAASESPAIVPPVQDSPAKGNIRFNLQRRVRELESLLLDRQRRLVASDDAIHKLEVRVKELEDRLREITGFRAS